MILALNGGGMRGALQVGALMELSCSLLETFKGGVYGISVGAIIATYIAFGFTPSDISEIFKEWVDVPLTPPSISALANAYSASKGGLDDGSIIRERMRQNFAKKGLDFDALRIRDAHIPLHIIATDVLNVQSVSFGGSMRVWDAVRASFSLPLVFEPHNIQGKLFIDGAVLCGDISTCIPVADRPNAFFLLTTRSIPSESYFEVVWSGSSTRSSYDIQKRYPDRTCLIVDNETPTFDMWSNTERVMETIDRGRAAMRDFIATHADFFGPSADTKKCS
jgi:hypothetical protein